MKKKNNFKIFSMILFALMSFVVLQTTVYAAGEHKFSFKAWQCGTFDEDEEMCAGPNNDYPMPEDLPAIALGNGSNIQPGVVNAGDLIQLAVYYEPGDETFWNMSAFVIYDPDLVQPLHYDDGAGGLVLVQTSSPYNDDYPGPYPPAGESGKKLKQTNWVVSFNDSLASYNITSVIKDNAGSAAERKYLEDSGSLYYVYFKIKDDVEPGTVITFSYNMAQGKTKIANNAPVISESGTVQVYKELDTDTTLSNLTVSDGTTNYLTNFNSNTKTYNVYVPNSVSSVTVTGTPTKGTTTAVNDPSGAQSLTVSTTKTVNIVTLAESGDTDTYTVNIYRLDNNANLTALSLGSGVTLSPTFASGTISYTATVPYATSSVNVSATKASTKANVSGTGSKNLTAGGVTNIQVVVTPECAGSAYSSVPGNSGTACQAKTYTVAVTRAAASTNNYLSNLEVVGKDIGFVKTNNGPYNLEVNGSVGSVTINATVEDTGKATIKSGSSTGTKTLTDGNNQFTITVVPESTTPERTYTINVYRKSNSVNLSGLTVTSSPQGTLNPTSFNPSTKTYTYTVGPDVTSVTITPTSNKNATITANGTSNGAGGFTYNPQTQTTATIHVVSEDETDNTDYTVNLVRNKSTDTTLSELSVAGYTISPAYSDSTNTYDVTVPSTETSVTVTATPNDSRTTATVSGNTGLTTGTNNVTVTVTPENGSQSARTITIRVKKQAADADLTALTLTNVSYTPTFNKDEISYSKTVPYTTNKTKVNATLSDSKATKTVKLNGTVISENTDVDLVVGTNTFTVEVKAEDRNVTKTYTVTVTRTAPSTNNKLSTLKVNNSDVPNWNNTNNGPYNVTVGYDTTKANIVATAEDTEFAVVTGDTGENNLQVGDNTFTVTVTPQDPATASRTYTIVVHRQDNNANLGSLTVTSNPQGTLNPSSFSAGTTSYTYTVGPDVTEVTIAATKGKANQTEIVGTGTYNPQTTNKVDIVVKAEDSTKTKTYTVNLARTKSTDTTLDELSVGTYTLSPDYGHNVNSYNVTVPSTVNSVSVTATPHDSRTTATVTGGTNLQTGNNTVTVTVVPENGETSKRTITITVKKLAGNADLTNLTLTNVSYTPTFDKDEISYSKTVPYTTNKTKVNATLSDSKATKTVKLNGTVIAENTDVDLVVGVNTFTVEVKAEDTNVTKTYTVTVTREDPSTNNYLSTLEVVGKNIGFDKTNNGPYDLTVKSNVTSVTINATVEDTGKATIKSGSKTGTQQLVEGNNEFTITVVPESTTPERTYTINVYKQNGDTTLGSLTVTANPAGTLSPASYNAGTKEYTYTVGPDVTEVTVSATKANEKQKSITGTGTFNPQTVTKTELVVTAEDDSTDTYTINFVRSESANANLSALGVEGYERLNEDFDANITDYTLTVNSSVESVLVTATLADSRASKSGDQLYVFGESNVINATVTVTAEDQHTTKDYNIVITRQSADATLTALTLENVELTFTSGNTSYTATVPYATDKTKVSATLSDTNAIKTVKLNGNVIAEDTDVDLAVGENTFTVEVKAEDRNVTKTYTVVVTRTAASTNSYLSGLTVDGFDLDPDFTSEHQNYDIGNVGSEVPSITITATKADDLANVSGDIGQQQLVEGQNTFTIVVTPEDPNELPREYTITAYKQNGNTTLGSLSVTSNPQGTLDPAEYNAATKTYTYTVGPDVTEVTVSATKANDKQKSITGTGTFNPQTVTKTELVVTAEDDSTDTYTVNFVRNKSTNADLSALGVEGFTRLNEDFDPNETNYTLTVPSATTSVTVTATLADDRASKEGDQVYVFGENTQVTATVTVTAEDQQTTKDYVIIITKQGANADLKGLTLDNVDIGAFSSGKTSYTATVPYSTDKTKVNATLSDTNATKVVKLNDEVISENTDVNLAVGVNTFTVTVTPEDTNADTKTYTVTVTRNDASSNALLSAIYIDGESIGELESGQFEYSVTVPNSTASVEVTVDTVDPTARVLEGTGTKDLAIGDNTVTISVEAEDGTPATYTLTIRKTDTIDTLSAINITSDPEGSMDKAFAPNQTEYTYTIDPNTESVTVTPVASSDNATVTVNGEPVGPEGYTFDPNDVDEVVIVVTPEEGEPKTYTVTIKKELDTNNYLSGLTVDGYDINPVFDKNTPGYTLTVNMEVESIKVTATPEVETSTAVITGATEDGVVSLPSEENVITITVHPQDPNADTRDYTLTVTKIDDSEYITSVTYGHVIDDSMIRTVKIKTLPETLKDQLDNENEKLHIFKGDDEISETTYVGTGMIVKLISDDKLKDYKAALIMGDVDGNGEVELVDVMTVLNHYLGNKELQGIYFVAGDYDGNGEIELIDVMNVLKIYLDN